MIKSLHQNQSQKNIFEGLKLIDHSFFKDKRGEFKKLFCKDYYSGYLKKEIKQINISTSKRVGTIRGFHYKCYNKDEEKIVTCLNGKIHDVIIDLRKSSPTFLKSLSFELSENDKYSLFIPKGFAHGYQSLSPRSQVLYFHTNTYKPEYEKGINVRDDFFNIIWPKKISVISKKDLSLPNIRDLDEFKKYL